jgi:hypothetical protein
MAIVKRFLDQWDRATAVVFAVIGFIALLLGYNGVSNNEFVAAQIPYFVSGGLVGLFLLGLAGVLWLSSDLRDEWVKLDEIEETLNRIEQTLTDSSSNGAAEAKAPDASATAAPAGAAPRAPRRPRRANA